MISLKRPEANLKLGYRKALELGLIGSLFLNIVLFHAAPELAIGTGYSGAEKLDIVVEEIPPTEQVFRPPPPPRPSVPIPVENEEIPEDLTIEPTELELADIPPPPPPPETQSIYKEYVFIAYDEAPTPIGGFRAIQKHLKYPEIARRAGIEARVVIGVLIDEEGNPVKTQVLLPAGGSMGFEKAACTALESVKWNPARQRDRPVKVWVSVPVNFRLDKANT